MIPPVVAALQNAILLAEGKASVALDGDTQVVGGAWEDGVSILGPGEVWCEDPTHVDEGTVYGDQADYDRAHLDMPKVPAKALPTVGSQKRHWHRPGEKISERYVDGNLRVVYRCRDCDEILPERGLGA